MNKKHLSNKEFNGLVANICRSIAISNWRPDYIVGITNRGLPGAVMISHYFKVPLETLKISAESCESNAWMSEDAFGYQTSPKNILVVDGINDSGDTINWLINDWPSSCLPNDPRWSTVWNNTVRFAVLFDNLESKSIVKMDYCGQEITTDEAIGLIFPHENWWE